MTEPFVLFFLILFWNMVSSIGRLVLNSVHSQRWLWTPGPLASALCLPVYPALRLQRHLSQFTLYWEWKPMPRAVQAAQGWSNRNLTHPRQRISPFHFCPRSLTTTILSPVPMSFGLEGPWKWYLSCESCPYMTGLFHWTSSKFIDVVPGNRIPIGPRTE